MLAAKLLVYNKASSNYSFYICRLENVDESLFLLGGTFRHGELVLYATEESSSEVVANQQHNVEKERLVLYKASRKID